LGGITPMLLVPGISRRIPPPNPIPLCEPKDEKTRVRVPKSWPMPPCIVVIPPVIGDKLNDVRVDPIADVARDVKERLLPPPMRYGMKPPKLPAYGTTGLPAAMPAIELLPLAP